MVDKHTVMVHPTAYERHPERFKGRIPRPMEVPAEVWINKPSPVSYGGIH
jgi:hypothetical protein